MHKEKQFNYQPPHVVLFSASQTPIQGLGIPSSAKLPQKALWNLLTFVYISVFNSISVFELLFLRPLLDVNNT